MRGDTSTNTGSGTLDLSTAGNPSLAVSGRANASHLQVEGQAANGRRDLGSSSPEAESDRDLSDRFPVDASCLLATTPRQREFLRYLLPPHSLSSAEAVKRLNPPLTRQRGHALIRQMRANYQRQFGEE